MRFTSNGLLPVRLFIKYNIMTVIDTDKFPFDDEDIDDFPLFTEEELRRTRAEIIANNPEGKNRILKIPRDENGKPIGYTLEEVFAGVDKILSEAYGVDFAKVSRMIESGELNDKDITNELLGRPEFEYKPYPGFKPKPIPGDFNHKPWLSDALSEDDELDEFPRFTEEELNRMRAEILGRGP